MLLRSKYVMSSLVFVFDCIFTFEYIFAAGSLRFNDFICHAAYFTTIGYDIFITSYTDAKLLSITYNMLRVFTAKL